MKTIKSSTEISEFFSEGKRFSNKYVTFLVRKLPKLKNSDCSKHDPSGRVAFIAGKKHGNAVWRNSAKRRLREIYKINQHLVESCDILFIAKANILDGSFDEVLKSCNKTLNLVNKDTSQEQ